MFDDQGQMGLLVVLVIILGVIAGSGIWWQNRSQEKISIIDTHFSASEVGAGQATILTVTIKNMSDKTIADNVQINVTSIESSVSVANGQLVIDVLGPRNERSPNFEIIVDGNAIKGTYTIHISVSTSDVTQLQGDDTSVTLTVT